MPVEACTFPNLGWLEIDTPEHIQEIILTELKNGGEDWRWNLAGHTTEAKLVKGLMTNQAYAEWLIEIARRYDQAFPAFRNTICHHRGELSLALNDVWVNHQKKHDFNPMHWHAGVFSFVTWLNIPFSAEKERAQYASNNPAASEFSFTVVDVLGEVHDHAVEQREWKTLFFPARMRHKVNPFYTTDETRVSLAGNLDLV